MFDHHSGDYRTCVDSRGYRATVTHVKVPFGGLIVNVTVGSEDVCRSSQSGGFAPRFETKISDPGRNR